MGNKGGMSERFEAEEAEGVLVADAMSAAFKRWSARMNLEPKISLRDHFAGLAMQGLIAADCVTSPEEIVTAQLAYAYADAMLVQREQK